MRTQPIPSSGNTASSAGAPRTDGHVPVLLHESLETLAIKPTDTVVDATLGGAGHAREIVAKLGEQATFVGFDLDPAAIERARKALSGTAPRIELINANFRTVADALHERGIVADKMLFDLGWSSYQLDAGRGFSFLKDEPLNMNYGTNGLTAADIVNSWQETSLADVIYGFGEERFARRIARAIVTARARGPIVNARELGEIVKSAVPVVARRGRIHPATKTFQALRMAVNDELGSLEEALTGAWDVLRAGGRIAVISFHSIEDRIVKNRFLSLEKQGLGTRVGKKPIAPSNGEIAQNPRSRSAKLRTIEKL